MLDLGTLQAHIKLDGAEQFKSDLDDSGSKAEGLGSKLKGGLLAAGKMLTKVFVAGAAAVGAAFVAITKGAVDAYSETEQLRGGVQKLFGEESAKTIEANAQAAFATVGISANEYMQNVTSFSASLLQSLGGDTEAAANAADMAMRDMADNANVFGTDMASIQSAYQGFAKGQYQLLDNLKLGYGGTQSQMERLLADAGKLTGKKYDIKNLNDVYEAIHAIQEEQGIAGTTAAEANKTISGSIKATKAAYQNLLAGLADPNADLGALVDNVVNSAMNVVDNIVPVIERIVDSVSEVLPKIVNKISQLLPKIIPVIENLLTSIGQALPTLLTGLLDAIIALLPTLLETAMLLVEGIVDALPQIIDAIVEVIPKLIQALINILPRFIPAMAKAGVVLFTALIKDLPAIILAIVKAIPQIVKGVIEGWKSAGSIFKQAGIDLFGSLGEGFSEAGAKVSEWFGKIGTNITSAIGNTKNTLKQKGKDFLNGLKSGAQSGWSKTVTFYKNLSINTVRAVGTVSNTLVQKGKDLLAGLSSGSQNGWSTAKTWFGDIKNKAFNAIGAVGSSLTQKGSDLLSGLYSGVTSKWSTVSSWFSGLGGKVVSAVGSLGTKLYNAGSSIIQGFLNGITAKWEAVKTKVKSIGPWIAQNKGPKDYDLNLLVPNGGWIMEGLSKGIEKGKLGLKKTLSDVANTIAGSSFNASSTLVYGRNGAAAAALTPNGTTYNLYINGARVNDDSQIEGLFASLLTQMARKGMM